MNHVAKVLDQEIARLEKRLRFVVALINERPASVILAAHKEFNELINSGQDYDQIKPRLDELCVIEKQQKAIMARQTGMKLYDEEVEIMSQLRELKDERGRITLRENIKNGAYR